MLSLIYSYILFSTNVIQLASGYSSIWILISRYEKYILEFIAGASIAVLLITGDYSLQACIYLCTLRSFIHRYIADAQTYWVGNDPLYCGIILTEYFLIDTIGHAQLSNNQLVCCHKV